MKRFLSCRSGRVLLAWALLGAAGLLGGCHTIGGIGKDLQTWSGTEEKPGSSTDSASKEPKNPYR